MAKTTPKRKQPFDIFGDDRLEAAMQAATAPGEGAGEAVAPREVAKREQVPTQAPRSAAAAAVAPPSPAPPLPAQAAARQPDPASVPARGIEDHVPFKFEVPRSIRAEFQAFRAELGAALGGVALDNSNIGRAVLARLLGPERKAVLAAARRASGTLTRPRNDDAQAMAAFDAALRELFARD